MDVQTNEGPRGVRELVEVTRALAEGDFEQKLQTVFQGELGQLAVYIETLRDNLQVLSPRFASSARLMPEAGHGVAEISQQAELSVNSILRLVDEMCLGQDIVSEMLAKAADGGVASLDIATLQEITDKTSASLMNVMSFLSFQDVVRQRAEKVQMMIDSVDEKIRELLAKFKVQAISADEKEEKTPGEVGLASAQDEVDQTSIDDLFE